MALDLRNSPPLINLSIRGFGLIIPCESGVAFSNQAGGTTCSHPRLEGIFFPLPCLPKVSKWKPYIKYFPRFLRNSKWGIGKQYPSESMNPYWDLAAQFGDKFNSPDEMVAKKIEELIFRYTGIQWIKVDTTATGSQEAWVWVNIIPPDRKERRWQYEYFRPSKGVLVWQNSD